MTVADLGNAVLIGGYLILNGLGRPLEFHCTEPVKPNRAQEILYGPTLRCFLCGEQIGQALLRHGQHPVELILTDCEAVLALREFTDTPVVCVNAAEATGADSREFAFWLGQNRVSIHAAYAADRSHVEQIYQQQIPDWDLSEPFQRITEAVRELQKAA